MQKSRHPLIKLAFMYLIAWCISPPLAYGGLYRILAFLCFGLILAYVVPKGGFGNSAISGLLVLLVIALYMGFTGDSIGSRLSTLIMITFIACSKFFSSEEFDPKEYRKIILFTFVLCIVWNFASLKGIAERPNVMRLLAKNSDTSVAYSRRGVGGYGYLYTILVLLPIGMDYVLSRDKPMLERGISLAFVASSCVLIFQSQYFLAMIIMCVIPFIHMISKARSSTRALVIFFTAVLMLLIYINAEAIIGFLYQIVPARSLKLKLLSMYELLINDGSVTDSEFATRYIRYTRDLSAMLLSPLFGCFTYAKVGNHSHFLDFFAQYGIPLGCMYVSMLFKPFKRYNILENPGGYTAVVVFIMIGLMNTIAFAFGSILYFILPIHCAKEIYPDE